MPEGPETHRRAEQLRRALLGETLKKVGFFSPALKRFERTLRGQRVTSIDPRGKAMLTSLDGGWTIYSHSQLFGFWRIDAPDAPRASEAAPRLVLQTATCRAELFGTSAVSVHRTDEIAAHPYLRKLGPDVIAPGTTTRDLRRQFDDARFARKPLSTLLLDQAFAGGMGNYLRSDVLYAARLAPSRTPASLDARERTALAKAMLAIPRRSFAAQLKTLDDPAAPGYRFLVFEREGERCARDGHRIRNVRLAARRLYWCPGCQR